MKKLLLINGSSRMGNCSIIFNRLKEKLNDNIEAEIIDLRRLKIGECFGCSIECDECRGCVQKDDMGEVLRKMVECDMMIIASPNYFQNVTGITKKFFDRTTPIYPKRLLRGKKLIFVFVGGLSCEITESTVKPCANGWARPMKLDWLNTYVFQATKIKNFIDPEDTERKIAALIEETNNALKDGQEEKEEEAKVEEGYDDTIGEYSHS